MPPAHFVASSKNLIVCVDCCWIFDPEDGNVADAPWCLVLEFVWVKITFGSVSRISLHDHCVSTLPPGLTLLSQNVVVCRNDICKNCCREVHGHLWHQADVCTCTRGNSDLSEHVRIRHVHS